MLDQNNHISNAASITDTVSDQERPLTVKQWTISVGLDGKPLTATQDLYAVLNYLEQVLEDGVTHISIVKDDIVLALS